MHKRVLFARASALWPVSIDLTDDISNQESGDGIRALNDIIWPLLEPFDAAGDEWMGLAAWAFHQSLWALAEIKIANGDAALRTAEVPIDLFDAKMRENLSDDSWAEERSKYEANSG